MADETIALDVKVNGTDKAIKNVKDLKNAIKEATNEQINASEKFGISSKEYIEASKKVSALKDKVDDLKDSTKSLQGSGIERSAQGFNQLGEGLRNLDFDKVKVGLTAMKSALAATGIGLIVALVSTLSEKFDLFGKITDVVTGIVYAFTDAIGLTNKAVEAQTKAVIDSMDKQQKSVELRYDNEAKIAKASGKNVEDIELKKLKAVEESLNEQIKYLQAKQLTKFGLNDEELKKFEELQVSLLNASADTSAKEIEIQKKTLAQINSARQLDASLDEKLRVSKLSGRALALDSVKQNEQKLLDELSKNNQIFAGNELQGTIAYNESKKKIQELAKIEEAKINDEFNKQDAEKNKTALAKKFADQQSLTQQHLQDSVNQNKAFADILKAEQDAQDVLDNQKQIEVNAEKINRVNLDLRTEQDLRDEARRIEFDRFKADKEQQYALEKSGIQAGQSLSDAFFAFKSNRAKKGSAEELELAKKQFNINKAFNLAGAVVDGYKAVISTYAQTKGGVAAKTIAAAFAGIASAGMIAKIASAKFQGGETSAPSISAPSGGGGNESIIPQPTVATPTRNTSTTFDENGNTSGNGAFRQGNTNTDNQPVRAYVVETEITNKQKDIQIIKNQSTF